MSAQAIDFSKYEQAAAPSIDFSKYVAPAKPQPTVLSNLGLTDGPDVQITDHARATLSGVQSIGRGLKGAAVGTMQLLDPRPKNPEEEGIVGSDPRNAAALPLYRILRSIGHTAEDATQVAGAVRDINNSSDPVGTYMKAAQETAGQGAGQALFAIGTDGLVKAAPKALAATADAVDSAVDTAAPAVRAGARGVNTVLKKAPGTVGGTVGAGIGGYLGGQIGAELGGAAGVAVGKEILPGVRIPGEGFGLPARVAGGPAEAPQYVAPVRPSPELPEAFQPVPAKAPPVPGTADHPFQGPAQPVPVRQPPELPAAFQPIPPRYQPPTGTAENPFQAQAAPQFHPAAGSLANSVTAPEAATPEPMSKAADGTSIPRTLSGESSLRDVLARQDNANLLKIARSRGINVGQESQLKPSVADGRLIDKIVADFSDDELDGFRATYLENHRIPEQLGPQSWRNQIGAEANKTLALQTYFPDVKIPKATLARTQSAVTTAKTIPEGANTPDLLNILKQSLAQQQRAASQ
jgi:hypothetical protein